MSINLSATKEKIINTFGSLQTYKDSRPFRYVTLQRFLKVGIGPRAAARPTSKSQAIAAFLKADGLLVESGE